MLVCNYIMQEYLSDEMGGKCSGLLACRFLNFEVAEICGILTHLQFEQIHFSCPSLQYFFHKTKFTRKGNRLPVHFHPCLCSQCGVGMVIFMDRFWDQIVIDKTTPIPFYFQLKEAIERGIKQKLLQIGDQIPSETQLCDLLHLSRPTVHQALMALISEGYLSRSRGHGTYVTNSKISGDFLKCLQNFSSEMLHAGLQPSTQVLKEKIIIDNTDVNEKLNLPLGEPCFYLERLRSVDGLPLVYLETYLPYKRFEGIEKVDFECNSLYDTLETKYSAPVYCAKRQIEAVNANAHMMRLLDIPKDAAICLVKTIGFDQQGVPIEYSIANYRGDRNRFTVTLYKGQSL